VRRGAAAVEALDALSSIPSGPTPAGAADSPTGFPARPQAIRYEQPYGYGPPSIPLARFEFLTNVIA
jgi:hypothetical protein